MADLKTVVGELLKKEEGKGKITCVIDVGTKFPINISAWMEAYQQPGVPAPIMAQLEAIKPGMKVEATYSESPGKNKAGAPVMYKNLYGIALVTDSTPVKAPEKARSDGQTPPSPAAPAKPADNKWETVEEKRNSMAWMNAFNNASLLYAPIMFEDYKTKGLSPDEIGRHGGNVSALAGFLHDELDAAIRGAK